LREYRRFKQDFVPDGTKIGVKKSLVVHPILFGLYPVLALFAHNISSLSIWTIYRPGVVMMVAALLLLCLARLILRDWYKAGLADSWLLIVFFAYGQVFTLIRNFTFLGIRLGRDTIFAVVWLILLAAGWWGIARKLKNGKNLTQVFNVVGAVALLFPLLQIGYYEIRQLKTAPQSDSSTQSSHASPLQADSLARSMEASNPDVYYIILDTYPRADVISSVLGIDNSSFINTLKTLGFYVAECSQSNYGSTVLSLTSSLNMDYLDQINPEAVKTGSDSNILAPQLLHNRVTQDFKAIGYRIVAFESGFSPTEWQDADIYIHQSTSFFQHTFGFPGLNPFEGMLFNTTPGLLYLDLRIKLGLPRLPWFEYAYVEYRSRILYELEQLDTAASIPGLKFVFVHILAPHTPIVFGPNGETIARDYPFKLNQDEEYSDFQKYRREFNGELTYINRRIEEFVRKILSDSAVPPVIIIQGDHGLPKAPDTFGQMGILNAYYLPSGAEKLLYPSITPVNSFRVVFNQLFGGQFPLLADVSYQSQIDTPFKLNLAPGVSGCDASSSLP
jgi:hypothetical protein